MLPIQTSVFSSFKRTAFGHDLAYLKEGKEYLNRSYQQLQDKNLSEAKRSFVEAEQTFNKILPVEKTPAINQNLAQSYLDHGDRLLDMGYLEEARASYEIARTFDPHSISQVLLACNYETVEKPSDIQDVHQLALCLRSTQLESSVVQGLNKLAHNMLQAFSQKKAKNLALWREIIPLAATPDPAKCRFLLEEFYKVLANRESVLDFSVLPCLAILIHNLPESLFKSTSATLAKVLNALTKYLEYEYSKVKNNTEKLQLLLQATSQILDEIAKAGITGITYTQVQKPLDKLLFELSQVPDLQFQAYYARQALAHIPKDNIRWQELWSEGPNIILGAPTVVSALRALDLNEILEIFDHFSEVFSVTNETANRLVAELGKNDLDKSEISLVTPGRLIKTRQLQWYAALQFLDICIEQGQFVEFEQFVRHSVYTQNVFFLLGLCQRLEQIARMHRNAEVQKGAKQFLESLLQGKPDRDERERVIRAAEAALGRLKQSLPNSSQDYVPIWSYVWHEPLGTQLLDEVRGGNVLKQMPDEVAKMGLMLPNFSNQSARPSLDSYLPRLTSSFSNPAARIHSTNKVDEISKSVMQISDGLINNQVVGSHNEISVHYYPEPSDTEIQKILKLQSIALQPNIAPLASLSIEQLQKDYLEGLQKDNEIKDTLAMYVAPECTSAMNTSEHLSLEEKVRDFLISEEKKVLLLLGEAGSGKSTFSRHLALSLWEKYDKEVNKSGQTFIPLFIPLLTLENPNNNLIPEYLKREGLTENQITVLKENYHFVFILDGYDEIKNRTSMFYVENELDQWKAKVIITSRPEYLGENYQRQFHPFRKPNTFQEYHLALFSEETVKQYIDQYSQNHSHALWSVKQYKAAIEELGLERLMGNPFLLKITLNKLPELSEKFQLTGQGFTRFILYEQFVKSWFERSKDRLKLIQLTLDEKNAFHYLNEKGFIQHGIDFSQEFALALYQKQSVVATYLTSKPDRMQEWSRFLSNQDPKARLLRFNAPLSKQGSQYRFIHKSLQDYLVARALGAELSEYIELEPSSWFNTLNIANDPAIWQFLLERVQQESNLKTQLLRVVERSKKETEFGCGAANAMTLLVKARVQFNGTDLKGIQIPGADLSNGVFDSAKLQGADLSQVNFRNSWLRHADLSAAKMAGVRFGEWAYLQEESAVNSCAYSPDGENCAVGLANGKIRVYKTSNWEKSYTLEGHTSTVWSVVYSPSGTQIASGSFDKTVRLWDAQSGAAGHTLEGHTSFVSSVVYSPSGTQIASGSFDKTVRLWDAHSGALEHTLEGHTSAVFSVAYSPSGRQLASGSDDKIVRLWDAQSGAAGHTLEGHTSAVLSVVYSPSGSQLASGSFDKTVRLWDAESGSAGHTLEGHTSTVRSVVYSPSGSQLASGSFDKTVRLWDAESGSAGHTLEGHTSYVRSVAYSPSGRQLASGSDDKIVRLWDAQSGAAGHTLEGHTSAVLSVVYSPSGTQFASGSDDNTVRLWDAHNGAAGYTLKGHTASVNSVVYSPSGTQFASGSDDNTVRLWDAHNGAAGYTLKGHTDSVKSVAYSPSGSQIASGSEDKTVRLWDAHSGASVHNLEGHTSDVTSVVYSPSGSQIASGSSDKTVRLWDAESGASVHTLEGHTSEVTCVVYSPSGTQIASGSKDETVRLWDAESGASVHTLEGHTGWVSSVVYSSSGTQIASGSWDNTVRLWAVASGECLKVIQGFTGGVYSVAWRAMPEGSYLLTGSGKVVQRRELIGEADGVHAHLRWMSPHAELNVSETIIEGVVGLGEMNIRLLKQRGARFSENKSLDFFWRNVKSGGNVTGA
ncbi:MAG: WD40 repeat [Glomeribacter sp. 1016415]|nr:WD40 repeat [Glomeribacter sp. 1016415]